MKSDARLTRIATIPLQQNLIKQVARHLRRRAALLSEAALISDLETILMDRRGLLDGVTLALGLRCSVREGSRIRENGKDSRY